MSQELSQEILAELHEIFEASGTGGSLDSQALSKLFADLGDPQPNYKIRDIFSSFDKNQDGVISFEEFCELYAKSGTGKVWGSNLRKNIKTRDGVQSLKTHEKSAEGTVHSAAHSEQAAFSRYFSILLKNDEDLKSYVPIKPEGTDFFEKLRDGVVLCKMVNLAVPNTIDERTINKQKLNTFTMTENINLALNSAKAIGMCIVNVGSDDFMRGTQHIVFGFAWQVLRMVLLKNISLQYTPQLACLLDDGETIEMLLAMSPEELLMRWVNYHLNKADSSRKMTNYNSDLMDSEIYATLLDRILPTDNPNCLQSVMGLKDNHQRGEKVIQKLDETDLQFLISAKDIATGNKRLNLALMAHLFNLYPCLEEVAEPIIIEETREEKMYRNWMNSLGVKPQVNYIYNDLSDGNIILQLFDIIKPNSVNWKKVNTAPFKKGRENMLKLENCNYACEVGKSLNLSLVGVSGDNIVNQDKKYVLGIVFQIMFQYIVSILTGLTGTGTKITDKDIIDWQNSISKTSLNSFKDASIRTSHPLCSLVDAIQNNSVNFEYLNPASTDEEKLQNAVYAVSCARKIGANVFVLPEDIAEGHAKNTMIAFACLYERHLKGK